MYLWFQNVFTDILWAWAICHHRDIRPTFLDDPIMLLRTFIKRACNKVPRTGKHVNHNNQPEEELAHAHF